MLEKLFIKLGYNRNNGLFVLSESKEAIIETFPSRISRVLTEVIKPYAVFSLDAYHNTEGHVQPFNNPLILFYENPSEEDYELIPKHSFNLSRSPIVIVAKDNVIEIFNGFDFASSNRDWLKSIDVDHDLLNISNLRSGKGWKEIHQKFFVRTKTVDRYLLSNITDARRILIARESNFKSGNLSPEVANRLIGRILFIRYLIDRNVRFTDQDLLIGINKEERQESLNMLLLDHAKTYDFFEYINQKFEGDLFPLYYENEGLEFYEKDTVLKENLEVLYYLLTSSNMFKGDTIKGYTVQQSLFNVYDFEIIPVELISNIYESFLGNTAFAKGEIVTKLSKQKEVKAFYTPPFLVDYMLSQTVKSHLKTSNGTDCKVLDPSCGSGIFLVESLRQIIDNEIRLQSNGRTDNNELISNERLWELLENNIYGIDIDPNAIEITIFSLYITLLDYKTHPREIENFAFKPLKGVNLFGGQEADFFNCDNKFNRLFKESVKLDFIVGNPPWGSVKKSRYVEYIDKRSRREFKASLNKQVKLAIGNKEISQAFMVRVEDLIQDDASTKICLIVTGKNIYNSDPKAVAWRKYFLNNFDVHQCFDLFGVNNKIAGGKQIFDNANQPPAIFLYSQKKDKSKNNVIKHIVARANLYYHYFKTIVIEKNDVKYVSQKLFLNDDKLWKILLYGNSLDYLFVKKIRQNGKLISELLEEENMFVKGGYKSKDSAILSTKRKDTTKYWGYQYVEVEGEKGLKQYEVNTHKTFKDKLDKLHLKGDINDDFKVPQISEEDIFKGFKLLIKKGLDNYLNHRAVSAVSEDNVVFSATVAAIGSIDGNISEEQKNMFYSMSAIFNSKLFIYYSFMTSSSFGAGRNRLNFNEFLKMMYIPNNQLSLYSKEIHEALKVNWPNKDYNRIVELENLIEEKISEIYEITPLENELINYALEVSLPVMKRADRSGTDLPTIFKEINESNFEILTNYSQIFIEHFSDRFDNDGKMFCIDAYVSSDFIAFHFTITKPRKNRLKFKFDAELDNAISKLGSLGVNQVSSQLFTQQDIRGFNEKSFYLIKPNIIKNWHSAVAHIDLIEFIEAIASSEINNTKQRIS
jgi:hypothetical protein